MIKSYFVPKTIDEAVLIKKQYGAKAQYLAGGTELNLRTQKDKYDVFIDLRDLDLNNINLKEDGTIEIGSGVTFQQLVTDERIPEQLKRAANFMENRNIRNIATIGGNIGGGKTVGDTLCTLIVLDSKLKLHGQDELVSVEEYLNSNCKELIERIIISPADLKKNFASRVYTRSSNDMSLVGAAVTYDEEDGKIKNLRIAIGGVSNRTKRLIEVEKKLEGKKLIKEDIKELVQENIAPITDIRGSKEFKKHIAGELVLECFKIN